MKANIVAKLVVAICIMVSICIADSKTNKTATKAKRSSETTWLISSYTTPFSMNEATNLPVSITRALTATEDVTTNVALAQRTTSTTTPDVTTNAASSPTITSTTTQDETTQVQLSSTTTSTITPAACPTGYQYVNGYCEDIDECKVNVEICLAGWTCHNLPGGHICDCVAGTLRREIDMDWVDSIATVGGRMARGSNVWACVYSVPVTQRFGLSYVKELSNKSSAEYKNLTAKLYKSIQHSYLTPSASHVVGLNIKGVTPGSIVLHYAVLTITDTIITPTELKTMFNESVKNGYWNAAGVLPGVQVDAPLPAAPQCYRDTFYSREVLRRNFSFPTVVVGTTATSIESCTRTGYSAAIKCVENTLKDGTTTAIYDSDTLKESNCSQTAFQLFYSVNTMNITIATLETTSDQLNELSKNITSSSKSEVKILMETLEILLRNVEVSDIDVTESTLSYLTQFADNLHDAEKSTLATNETLLDSQDRAVLINAMDIFASNLVLEGETLTFRRNSNIFHARKINCSAPKEVNFDEKWNDQDNEFQPRVTASIPASAIPVDCVSSLNAVFYMHKDDTFFPTPSGSNGKINQVFSSQLSRTKLKGLKSPIVHAFSQPVRNNGTEKVFVSHRCAYLDTTVEEWKFDGCATIVVDSGMTSCSCDHTTNFAVIVQTYTIQSSYAINIVGYIGCSLSALSLLLVLIIYIYFRKLRKNEVNQLHINLSVCLLIVYLTFLFGVERPRAYVPCITVGAILQFTLLSAWGWMLTECITMYKKFVTVFGDMSSRYVMKASFIVYVTSLFVTAITVAVAYVTGDLVEYQNWASAADNDPLFHPSYYVSDRLCWLHGYSLCFGFLTPVAIMFLLNLAGFIRISIVLTKSKAKLRSNKVKKDEAKDHVYRVLTVSVLLGISWAFAIPLAISSDTTVNEVFSWLFSISNAFQGVFIFLLFCVKRKDVRVLWASRLTRISFRKSKLYDVQATATGSTGVSGDTFDTLSGVTSSDITYKAFSDSQGVSPYLSFRKDVDVIALNKIDSMKSSPSDAR